MPALDPSTGYRKYPGLTSNGYNKASKLSPDHSTTRFAEVTYLIKNDGGQEDKFFSAANKAKMAIVTEISNRKVTEADSEPYPYINLAEAGKRWCLRQVNPAYSLCPAAGQSVVI